MQIQSSASFPEGGSNCASLAEVNKLLTGRVIVSVEYLSFNTIKFTLDDGSSVLMEPDGLEGDDLSLTIDKQQ